MLNFHMENGNHLTKIYSKVHGLISKVLFSIN